MSSAPKVSGLLLALAACASSPNPPPTETATLGRAELLDPNTCKTCHPEHFRDWAASLHAYASDDPVFRAMQRRGQRETGGMLGTFCLRCHAPLAVRDGLLTGTEDLDSLTPAYRGITCAYCHSVDGVVASHNNGLQNAEPQTMRGPIAEPLANPAHRSAWSPLHNRDRLESSALCGSCHDVVTPPGAPLERSFLEWQASVFNRAPGGTTCGQCHMPQGAAEAPVATAPGAPLRRAHSHLFPAVDLPLTPWPDLERLRVASQAQLDKTLQLAVCVEKVGAAARLAVILGNLAAGHGFPSGAALDRRLWVEVVAQSGGQVTYASGALADDATVTDAADPDLWLLRDCGFDAAGKEVHMFWEVAKVVGNALPAQATFLPTDPRFYQSHRRAYYPRGGALLPTVPDAVSVRVRLQPVAREVLDDLVASGDLAPALRARIQTWQVGQTLTWTAMTATHTFVRDGISLSCAAYGLDPRADTVPAVRLPHCAPE